MWPIDRFALSELAATSARGCDWCGFFVSVTDRLKKRMPALAGHCEVVNLAWKAGMGFDPLRSWTSWSNQIPKMFNALRHVGSMMMSGVLQVEWVCMLETDVYFIPENFRRLVALLQISPDDVHWLGHVSHMGLEAFGPRIEPAGSCLSKAALLQITRFLDDTLLCRHQGADYSRSEKCKRTMLSQHVGRWPGIPCSAWGLGNQHNYQVELSTCFRAAGVYPSDPGLMHDLWGRLYFPNQDLHHALEWVSPNGVQGLCSWDASLTSGKGLAPAFIFKGLDHLYKGCSCPPDGREVECLKTWVAEYPVAFHPHICSKCKNYAMGGRLKNESLSLEEIHRFLRSSDASSRTGSWKPKIDLDFAAAQLAS